MIERALKGIDLVRKVVLDAGTGAGNATKYLAGQGCRVISVDLNQEYIDDAKTRLIEEELRRVEFHRSNLSEMRFLGDESVDVVVANQTLSTVESVTRFNTIPVLREFHRVLRRGGSLVVVDYHPFRYDETATSRIHVELWRLHAAVAELLGEGHYLEYPVSWLRDRLSEIGFTDIEHSVLMEELSWSVELLEEHRSELQPKIQAIPGGYLRQAMQRKLEELLDEARGVEVRSGSMYLLKALKPVDSSRP
ncbi:MAG: class I SAM-dependent methyltransferase [Candidatus Geothermarchaeales archaeon]